MSSPNHWSTRQCILLSNSISKTTLRRRVQSRTPKIKFNAQNIAFFRALQRDFFVRFNASIGNRIAFTLLPEAPASVFWTEIPTPLSKLRGHLSRTGTESIIKRHQTVSQPCEAIREARHARRTPSFVNFCWTLQLNVTFPRPRWARAFSPQVVVTSALRKRWESRPQDKRSLPCVFSQLRLLKKAHGTASVEAWKPFATKSEVQLDCGTEAQVSYRKQHHDSAGQLGKFALTENIFHCRHGLPSMFYERSKMRGTQHCTLTCLDEAQASVVIRCFGYRKRRRE